MKKFLVLLLSIALLGSGGFLLWSRTPILAAGHAPVDFTIRPGSGVRSAAGQIASAGVPVQPLLLELLARVTGKSERIKAGSYEIEGGTTPERLVEQLVRGEFAQHALTVIEGWTFAQMRQAINQHKSLGHDTASLSDAELMARISPGVRLDSRVPRACSFRIPICSERARATCWCIGRRTP